MKKIILGAVLALGLVTSASAAVTWEDMPVSQVKESMFTYIVTGNGCKNYYRGTGQTPKQFKNTYTLEGGQVATSKATVFFSGIRYKTETMARIESTTKKYPEPFVFFVFEDINECNNFVNKSR